jgi:hypothetical protein
MFLILLRLIDGLPRRIIQRTTEKIPQTIVARSPSAEKKRSDVKRRGCLSTQWMNPYVAFFVRLMWPLEIRILTRHG